jgi:hypothetical protein
LDITIAQTSGTGSVRCVAHIALFVAQFNAHSVRSRFFFNTVCRQTLSTTQRTPEAVFFCGLGAGRAVDAADPCTSMLPTCTMHVLVNKVLRMPVLLSQLLASRQTLVALKTSNRSALIECRISKGISVTGMTLICLPAFNRHPRINNQYCEIQRATAVSSRR